MTGGDDGVPAVKIQISLSRCGVDPNVLAAPYDERKLLIGRDLILLFDVDQVF